MSSENNNNDQSGARREYLPISGKELAEIVISTLADRLCNNNQWLGEAVAYPGAKVQFAMRILCQPMEEGREVKFEESVTLDFSNPPDVVRILSGLPVWEQVKVSLDKYTQIVEKQVAPREELVTAAKAQVSIPAKPSGGR